MGAIFHLDMKDPLHSVLSWYGAARSKGSSSESTFLEVAGD